ncbi:5'-nucleotidase, lipoprotein e(P4) family [Helicobacter pylori]|uniref:5'-nucleotidase, lipoprotein e(P4) family n=1 Tax=Helicobacter pylori TaxID=210 RepID=UPI001ABA0992|nr:5'-nucleotidase, lipoprotein e(P4) family [Helicobacter pylori]WRE16017.1 5'-nucleotidase, lipoprotein e(P4) family [Helicobacter pylori]
MIKKTLASVLLGLSLMSVLNAKECVSPLTRSVKYHQQSAEIRALQLQSYKMAKMALDNNLKLVKDKKPAVILDLDETVLNTFDYAGYLTKHCIKYTPETWDKFEKEGSLTLVPGALDFLEYANSKGVKIFYISNRTQKNKAFTLKTLKSFKLPQVSEESVLLKEKGKPKAVRRELVAKDYAIVLQVGDTLHDFDALFVKDAKNSQEQRAKVLQNAQKFGTEWIILPNSLYGTWEDEPIKAWQNKK